MAQRSKRFFLLLAFTLLGPAAALSEGQAAEATRPYVTTANVNVRGGPGTQYRVVAEIKSGTTVNVAATDGEWLKVVSKHGNPPGYIPVRYARPTAEAIRKKTYFPEGSYVTTADTYVREGPGSRYKSVARIPKGTKIYIVDQEGDWLKVLSKHGKPPGYIEGKDARHE